MGYDTGSVCTVRLDCNNGKITYITRHGERECDIDIDNSSFYYPAIDSDENGSYKIERVGKAKSGNVAYQRIFRLFQARSLFRCFIFWL